MSYIVLSTLLKSVGVLLVRAIGFKQNDIETPLPYERGARITAIVIVAVAAIAAIFVAGLFVRSCYVSRQIENTAAQVQETKTAVIESEAYGEILEEKQKELESEQNQLRQKSIQTGSNYNNALRRDSAVRNSDFRTAKDRWCAKHPNDSKCRK